MVTWSCCSQPVVRHQPHFTWEAKESQESRVLLWLLRWKDLGLLTPQFPLLIRTAPRSCSGDPPIASSVAHLEPTPSSALGQALIGSNSTACLHPEKNTKAELCIQGCSDIKANSTKGHGEKLAKSIPHPLDSGRHVCHLEGSLAWSLPYKSREGEQGSRQAAGLSGS